MLIINILAFFIFALGMDLGTVAQFLRFPVSKDGRNNYLESSSRTLIHSNHWWALSEEVIFDFRHPV